MTETPVKPTGDPMNPWGMNRIPEGPFLYEGVEVPVITETSSRDEMLRYIRILEARLALTHVFVMRPENAPDDLMDLGPVLEHDLPPEDRHKEGGRSHRVFDLVRLSQTQVERVHMLTSGYDRVACLELHERFAKEHRLALQAEADAAGQADHPEQIDAEQGEAE